MNKITIVPALAIGLALAGCNNPSTTTTADLIAKIQVATLAACAVEPTAASIAALLAASNPGASAGVAIAAQLATQICKAVAATAAPASASSVGAPLVHEPVTMNGVTIQFQPVGTGK